MDVALLIDRYFPNSRTQVTIDVFDEKNIYGVYQRVVGVLTQHIEIEVSVLQAMSYCFYEILDNVLTHSGKQIGTVVTHYNAENQRLSVLVADDGIGIQSSLSTNDQYKNLNEAEALQVCVKDSVTDGKGMGFGLYSTSLLVRDAGAHFEIHSGHHRLLLKNDQMTVEGTDEWQGTIVYLELLTNKEINPQNVVANRTNVASQYNETFLNDNELDKLW